MRTAVFCDEYEPRLARLFLLDKIEIFIRQIERAEVRAAEAGERAESAQMKFIAPGFAARWRELAVARREVYRPLVYVRGKIEALAGQLAVMASA